MRKIVQRFDAWLSRRYGVFEFSQAPRCLLRLQIASARHRILLPDCQIERGEPVLLLHLWNDRLFALDTLSPGLRLAKTMQRSFLLSIRQASCYMEDHPELAGVRTVGGVTIFIDIGNRRGGALFVERLGFTILPYVSTLGRFGEFWENFYSWVLIWAYNPSSLSYYQFSNFRRMEFWISSGEFRQRFRLAKDGG